MSRQARLVTTLQLAGMGILVVVGLRATEAPRTSRHRSR
jgi:hypothetical protein